MSTDRDQEAEEKKQKFASAFDRVAASFDRVGPGLFAHFGRRLVEEAAPEIGARVLDIGAGRGAVLYPAASRVGESGLVVGIDLSAEMVRETEEEVKRAGVSNIDVRVMDAENLDFPDAFFDCVLCGFSVFFLPHLDRGIREFHRILKPGSKFGASCSSGSNWAAKTQQIIAGFTPSQERLFADLETAALSLPSLSTAKPQALDQELRDSGFHEIRDVEENTDFVFASEEEYWSYLQTTITRDRLQIIARLEGKDALERVREAIFQMLQEFRQPDGFHYQVKPVYTVATKSRK